MYECMSVWVYNDDDDGGPVNYFCDIQQNDTVVST